MDAVAEDADMTVLILDNQAIAMTGAQPTAIPSSSLETLVLGTGVAPEHFHVVEAHPRKVQVLADVLRKEMAHPGLSVVIAVRACIQAKKAFAKLHLERGGGDGGGNGDRSGGGDEPADAAPGATEVRS